MKFKKIIDYDGKPLELKEPVEWNHLVINGLKIIDNYLYLNEKEPVKFNDMKEKFGGLRLSLSNGDEYIWGMLSMLEGLSFSYCENCSSPGILRDGMWWRTLCDTCFKEQEKENERKSKETRERYNNKHK